MSGRDGFIVRDRAGKEIHFVPCAKFDGERERVLSGLLRRVDLDRFTVDDTRDAQADGGAP